MGAREGRSCRRRVQRAALSALPLGVGGAPLQVGVRVRVGAARDAAHRLRGDRRRAEAADRPAVAHAVRSRGRDRVDRGRDAGISA